MTGQRMSATIRDHTPEPDTQAREVLRLFEAKAATWAAKYAPDGPLAHRLASLSVAVSRYAHAGDRVLDLGCGTGELAHALAASGLMVAGCDISPQMLLRASRVTSVADSGGCAGWVRLEPDWRKLPFASSAFDMVVAASVLEYVADPAAVLHECTRVVRPGGVVMYTVPNLQHPVRWAERLADRLVTMTPTPSANGPRSRWNEYHVYLRASRQRHRIGWWLAASRQAGLREMPCRADGPGSALRLLVFRRFDPVGGPLSTPADEASVPR